MLRRGSRSGIQLFRNPVPTLGMLLGFLVIASPLSSGALPAVNVKTIVAPYRGTVHLSNSTSLVGCGSAKITAPSRFDLTTGSGGAGRSSTTRSCGSSPSGSSDSVARIEIRLYIPYHGGYPRITANLSYGAKGTLAINAGTCTPPANSGGVDCDTLAAFTISASAFIIDLTNGSRVLPEHHWNGTGRVLENATYCTPQCAWYTQGTNGTFSIRGTHSWAFDLSGGMVKSHRYAFELILWAGTNVYISNSDSVQFGASGSASLNLFSPGHGFAVTAITER
jgi:hypothetical protein